MHVRIYNYQLNRTNHRSLALYEFIEQRSLWAVDGWKRLGRESCVCHPELNSGLMVGYEKAHSLRGAQDSLIPSSCQVGARDEIFVWSARLLVAWTDYG